jgi:predicted HTH domain antitoxin
MNEINIQITDLPGDLTISELENYLNQTYSDTRINIVHDPIKQFKNLPPELFAKILGSTKYIRAISPYLSKNIRKQVLSYIYEEISSADITWKEIAEEIKINNNIVVMPNIYTDMSIFMIANPIIYNNKSVVGKSIVGNNIRYDTIDENAIIMENNSSFNKISEIEYLRLDMFAEHRILSKRGICLEYNNKYADEHLVNSYNNINQYDFEYFNDWEIKYFDIIEIMRYNYIAHIINNDVNIAVKNIGIQYLDGIYLNLDIKDQKDLRRILIPIFNEARDTIQNKVIKLTGAIVTNRKCEPLFLPKTK